MHTPHDIVITACGMLSALGIGCEESAAAWQEGESACFPPARIAAPAGCDALAGEVPPVALADLALAPKAYLDRQSELLLAAAALARSAGKLAPDSFAAERVGLAMGTAWGAVQTLDLFFDDYVKKGPRLVKPILFPHSYANAGISLVAMEWEARGPHLNFVSGNDASTQALIAALDLLRSGEADLIMAGGAEGLNATRWRARAAAGQGHLPPGEGAAVFLIEQAATARARGVTPLARLRGGASGDGAPEYLHATCTATMKLALADAGVSESVIRTVYATAAAAPGITSRPQWTVRIPEALYGDVEGASGALQTACALLDPESLPALILTCTPSGSASALVIDKP
jgi:3-oxoacyl-[acyl-carrier-protein] synthase II